MVWLMSVSTWGGKVLRCVWLNCALCLCKYMYCGVCFLQMLSQNITSCRHYVVGVFANTLWLLICLSKLSICGCGCFEHSSKTIWSVHVINFCVLENGGNAWQIYWIFSQLAVLSGAVQTLLIPIC